MIGRSFVLGLALSAAFAGPVYAACSTYPSFPAPLSSGTTANGSDVIDDLEYVGSCLPLGNSLSTTAPSINGDQTSGFYTPAAATVAVAATGSEIVAWTSGGENIVTGNIEFGGNTIFAYPDGNADTSSLAIGVSALGSAATTGLSNIAIGYSALDQTTAGDSTAIGYEAGQHISSATLNTAVGYEAMRGTSGSPQTVGGNTAVGAWAMTDAQAGAQRNTAYGRQSLTSLTTGSLNEGQGYLTGENITTGSDNLVMGDTGGGNITTGSYNVAMGSYALGIASVALTGSYNIGVGAYALYNVQSTAASNLAFGTNAGKTLTTGGSNVLIGPSVASTTLATGSNNILIGTSSSIDTASSSTSNSFEIAGGSTAIISATGINGTPAISLSGTAVNITSAGNLGIGNTAPSYLLHVGSSSASGIVAELQNSSGACTHSPGSGSETVSCTSDARLKKDIVDAGAALPWLGDMRVRDFTMRATGERRTGVIAQEMLTKHPDMVHLGPDGFYKVDEPDPWKLVKAIQELKSANDKLADELARRTAQIERDGAALAESARAWRSGSV